MPIGLNNALTVLRGNSPVDSDKDRDAKAAAARAERAPAPAAAPGPKDTAAQSPASSVILDMQSSAHRAEQAALVYSDKPRAASGTPAEAFVQGAVTAMRSYAEAQERLKQADATPATRLPRSLGDVQKLAARFKLFA